MYLGGRRKIPRSSFMVNAMGLGAGPVPMPDADPYESPPIIARPIYQLPVTSPPIYQSPVSVPTPLPPVVAPPAAQISVTAPPWFWYATLGGLAYYWWFHKKKES